MPSPAADPRTWRADTVDAPVSWYHALSDRTLAALDDAVRGFAGDRVTDLRPTDELRAAAEDDRRRLLAALEEGRGFVIVTAGRPDRYTPQELTAAYWLVGSLLGRPVEQNVQGTLLYDVKDTGQDVRYGARFSVTSAESTFHTDNSFGVTVADYVGLLCLNPARSGGRSQLVSAFAVREELMARHPVAWAALRRPFHVDRRGGLRPGDPPTVRVPVFATDGPGLIARYLRYWIEVGHEKAREVLTPAQVAALDVLDAVAGDPRLRVEFDLRPGDMYFINNRWLLHNRTAFEDHPEPERKRHLVRLWLTRGRAAGTPPITPASRGT